VANYSGHEVTPPKPLHDPKNVVDALVALIEDPKDTKIVGADGIVKIAMKNLVPALEEKIAAKFMHRTQIENPPPTGDSPGAVRNPVREGTEVRRTRRKAS
jgi:hypothetical protein